MIPEVKSKLLEPESKTLTEMFLDKYMFPNVMRKFYKYVGLMYKDLKRIRDSTQNDRYDFIKHLHYFIDLDKRISSVAYHHQEYIFMFKGSALSYFGDDLDEHVYTADGVSFQRIDDDCISYAFTDEDQLLSIHHASKNLTYTPVYSGDSIIAMNKLQTLFDDRQVFLPEDRLKEIWRK